MPGSETVPPELLAALELPPVASAVRMAGYDAAVWRADLADDRAVAVRLLRPGVPVDNELAALRLAAQRGNPVPSIIAHGHWDGRDAVVTTWCAGRSMGELLEDGGDTAKLGRLMGQTQARLHEPLPDGRVLCHLDFQPYNILVDGDEVTGIVDWSNARLGDAREDLAWTEVVLEFAPALLPHLTAMIEPFRRAWRDGYAERRKLPDAASLRPFLARAATKQVADWTPRVDAGECPRSVVDAARRIASRWAQ